MKSNFALSCSKLCIDNIQQNSICKDKDNNYEYRTNDMNVYDDNKMKVLKRKYYYKRKYKYNQLKMTKRDLTESEISFISRYERSCQRRNEKNICREAKLQNDAKNGNINAKESVERIRDINRKSKRKKYHERQKLIKKIVGTDPKFWTDNEKVLIQEMNEKKRKRNEYNKEKRKEKENLMVVASSLLQLKKNQCKREYTPIL